MPKGTCLHYEFPNLEEHTSQKKVLNYQANMLKQLNRFGYELLFQLIYDNGDKELQGYQDH